MSNDSLSVRVDDGEWHEVRGTVTLDYTSDTDVWVQSVTDAICVRLHRGDDPVCDCGQSAAR
jgi:hypothetical protein